MVAKTLEELQVYTRAKRAARAVTALLERPAFRRDVELWDQLKRSSDRVAPLIAEGFGQQTDRHFASYLYRARGSCNETRAHVELARDKRFVTEAECTSLCAEYVVIGKMLTRLIQHLRRDNRRCRG
jgi:four helix bundle protein